MRAAPHPLRLAASLAASAVIALLCLAPAAGAVVGGQPAERSDYPYFAVVGTGCGGTLVAPGRVLTAAHCAEAVGERPVVRVGPRNVRRQVRLTAINPVYFRDQQSRENEFPPGPADLMLLQLRRPVRGVPLGTVPPASAGLAAPGTEVITVGYGSADPRDTTGGDGVFRSGTTRIQLADRCREELGTPLLVRWSLCTRDPRMDDPAARPPFVSACFGDSGGPLVNRTAQGDFVVGVVSWGPSCGAERDPEIYADATVGHAFVTARDPVWAPKARARARIVGRPRVGSTVRCRARWIVRPDRVLYSFVADGLQRRVGASPAYRIRPADAGARLRCDAGGQTAGGRGFTDLSAPVRVRR